MVSVRGRVVPRDLLASPLTGDRCVYYLYTVEEWRASASPAVAGDGFWQLLERDEEIAEFYLQADGVRVIVSPQRAKVEREVGPPLREVDYGIIGRRARQILILPGDEIEVRALVSRADDLHDDARDYRELASRILLAAPDDSRLQIRLLRSA